MATIRFTENLKRHLDCAPQSIEGDTVSEIFRELFRQQTQLKGYLVDDQGRLRKHVLISIDNCLIQDKTLLSDPVARDSEIYIMQALSGG